MKECPRAIFRYDARRKSLRLQSVTASGIEPPVNALGEAKDIGRDLRLLAREQRAGAAEAGHHFVGDEKHVVRVADALHLGAASSASYISMPPAPRISGSQMNAATSPLRQALIKSVERRLLAARLRKRNAADVKQQRLISGVEHAARARRHRADRVAVIGVLQREDACARLADVAPKAERHLERDFDGRRAAIRKENVREARRRELRSAPAPALRPARASSRQRSPGRACAACSRIARDDLRMAVAVRDHPPRRDAIEDAPPVGAFRATRLRPLAIASICGSRPCCVKGCQIGATLMAESDAEKSAKREVRGKGAAQRIASSGSIRGRRPRRRTPPKSQIVRSLSAFSSPMKAMPRIGMARRLQRFDRQQRMIDRAEPCRSAQDDRQSPLSEEIDLQQLPRQRHDQAAGRLRRPAASASGGASPEASISMPSLSAARCGEAGVFSR